ncbi:MAG: CHAP domain-containing protein [Acidimicrobiales bacterium]
MTGTGVLPRRSRRAGLTVLLALLLLAGIAVGVAKALAGPRLTPLRAGIVSVAESQVGYRTTPSGSYCNKFSAYWDVGTADCGPGLRSEEWCADFAAWVWQQAGAEVTFHFATGDLSSASASFYEWGLAHGTWHPVGSGYTPQPGDVAVYGLDTTTVVAAHVAVVTGYTAGNRGPDVVNGDGDHTGFSAVEVGTDQYQADTTGGGEPLSGYVAPTAPAAVRRTG